MTPSETAFGRRFIGGWIGLIRRLAWPVLLLAIMSSVATLLYVGNNIGLNADVTEMMSDELQYRQKEIEIDAAFPQLVDNISVIIDAPSPEMADEAAERLAAGLAAREDRFLEVFYPDGDPFFRRNGLLYLSLDELLALSDGLAEAQPLLAMLRDDPSLRGLVAVLELAVEGGGEEALARLGPILAKIAETAEKVAAGEAAQLSWQEAMAQGADSIAERRKFVVVRPVLDFDTLEPATEAVEAIRSISRALGLEESPGLRIRVLGAAIMFEDELRSVVKDTRLVGILSGCLVIVLLFLGLRSFRLVVASLVTLVIGLIWTAGFATVAIGELNIISVAFAVLFIGLSVDFGIHFTLRYQEAKAGGAEHRAALMQAGSGVGGALALSAIAAAIGFFSFLPTSYQGVAELGLISGAGMFIALFANLTVLPALLCVLPARHDRRPVAAGFGGWFRALVERHARLILAGALALAVLSVATLPFAWFDEDPLNLRDPESESVSTLLELLDDPRVEPYDAAVLTEDLDAAAALAERLESLPEVREALTLRDLVPDRQDEKLDIIDEMSLFLGPLLDPAAPADPLTAEERLTAAQRLRALADGLDRDGGIDGSRLADAVARIEDDPIALAGLERALVANLPGQIDRLGELLEADIVTIDDLPEQLQRRLVAADGRAQVEIYPVEDLRDREARTRFVDAVRAVAPGVSGDPVDITEAGRAVLEAFRDAGLYAFALILLLLLAVLRSLRDTVLILGPLLLSALLTVAATVVIGQPFNFANVIVLPLLMGLGVAFGIQLVLRYRMEQSGNLLATSTPRAVVFSGLTTIGSFCSLSISSHLGTASMGLLLTIAISLTMVTMLVVLPALLVTLSRRSPSRRGG